MSDRLTVLVSISAENHSFIVAAREPRQYVVARSLLLSEGGSLSAFASGGR